MKKYMLLYFAIILSLNSTAQRSNVNNYQSFLAEQRNMITPSKTIVIWGTFDTWGKYDRDYEYYCQGKLDIKTYKKINSFIGVNLFSDSIKVAVPVSYKAKIGSSPIEGDIIKLKIRIYKYCQTVQGLPFFLVEEIL